MADEIKIEAPEAMLPLLKLALVAGANEETVLAEVLKAEHGLTDEEKNKVRMAMRLLSGMKGKIPEAATSALAGLAMKKSETEEKKTMPTKIIKSAAGVEYTVPEDAAPVVEALIKDADAQRAQAADLKKSLDGEVAERKSRDALAKAKADFPHLDPTKTAALLVKSETLGAEFLADLVVTLKQAEALAAAGPKEQGSSAGGGGGDAWSKIEAGGIALAQKSDGKLSTAQGVDAFLKTAEGRALNQAYQDERRASH